MQIPVSSSISESKNYVKKYMIVEMGLPMCNFCKISTQYLIRIIIVQHMNSNVKMLCKKLLMLTNSTNVRDGTLLNS